MDFDPKNPEVIRYLGRPIARPALVDCIKIMMRDLESFMMDLTCGFGNEGMPELQKVLCDNIRDTSEGYSFLSDEQNKIDRLALWRKVAGRLLDFPAGLEGPVSITEAGHQWLQNFDRFLRLLMTLMHCLGGAPPHISEIREFQFGNTSALGRNIVLDSDSSVISVARYHKRTQLTRKQNTSGLSC